MGKPAGRPKKKRDVSEQIKRNYIKAAEELAKEHGQTIEHALLSMMYNDKIQDSVKASIMKTYNDAMIVRESHQQIDVTKEMVPKIYVPKRDADSALEVIDGGQAKKKVG